MKRLVLALILAAIAVNAQAAQVTIAWDPNPAVEQVTGYTLYQGTASRTYDESRGGE